MSGLLSLWAGKRTWFKGRIGRASRNNSARCWQGPAPFSVLRCVSARNGRGTMPRKSLIEKMFDLTIRHMLGKQKGCMVYIFLVGSSAIAISTTSCEKPPVSVTTETYNCMDECYKNQQEIFKILKSSSKNIDDILENRGESIKTMSLLSEEITKQKESIGNISNLMFILHPTLAKKLVEKIEQEKGRK